MTVVAPLGGIEDRWRRLGNIRLGKKSEKNAPMKLHTFRLTSPNRALIAEVADLYGGTVAPWDQQWEVITETGALDVLVPPMPGAFTQSWELHTADGRQRMCDGAYDEEGGAPCRCPADLDERRRMAARGGACKPMTHLSLILPECSGLGVWRLNTGGYNAAAELGILRPLLRIAISASIYLKCQLRIEARSTKKAGEPRRDYVVPVVDVDAKFGEVLDSMGLLGTDVAPSVEVPPAASVPALGVAGDSGEPVVQRGDGDGLARDVPTPSPDVSHVALPALAAARALLAERAGR